ncbi:zwf [Acrasis kona]|uniref:Zwf n=1 Tax=Acrasis kona TaxID=1008807 RepID=A0AAW2YQ21_9EUKA
MLSRQHVYRMVKHFNYLASKLKMGGDEELLVKMGKSYRAYKIDEEERFKRTKISQTKGGGI